MTRPMVNVYEPGEDGVERLVYREMTDSEYEQWLADQQAAQQAAAPSATDPRQIAVSLADAIRSAPDDPAALKAAILDALQPYLPTE